MTSAMLSDGKQIQTWRVVLCLHDTHKYWLVGWLVCLTSQQHASVSQGWNCTDNSMCCHTETKVADSTFYLTQSQYILTPGWLVLSADPIYIGLTSPSTDPITPGAWQGSHWSANFYVTGMTRPEKILPQAGIEPWIFRSRGGCLNP